MFPVFFPSVRYLWRLVFFQRHQDAILICLKHSGGYVILSVVNVTEKVLCPLSEVSGYGDFRFHHT
jgi:hypothetical protein